MKSFTVLNTRSAVLPRWYGKFVRPITGSFGLCVFSLEVTTNIADQYRNNRKLIDSSRKAEKQEGKKS